jgi:hypothetical protein
MIYTDGRSIQRGDVVKMRDDIFMGLEDHGNLLAHCRYGKVIDIWNNNNQLSVRYEKMQDVAYAATNPDRVAASIFAHDAYQWGTDVSFVERGASTDAI